MENKNNIDTDAAKNDARDSTNNKVRKPHYQNSDGCGRHNSKNYRDCKTCGKCHPGECHLLDNSHRGGNCGDWKKENFFTKNDAKQYIKKMYTKQNYSTSNSDSDSNDEHEAWQQIWN